MADNTRMTEYISTHSIDFYVTDFYSGENDRSLQSVPTKERYLGETPLGNMLDSMLWSNMVVANMRLHSDLASVEHPTGS